MFPIRAVRIGVILALPLVLWVWLVQVPPGGIEDDGYFYAQIAYNAGVHGTWSFDGIHPTDGFHLLWAFLLAAISAVLGPLTEAKEVHLYAHCVAAVAVLVAISERFGIRGADRVLLLVLGLAGTLPMETPLVALLFLMLMTVVGETEERQGRMAVMAPAALLVMARVDAAVMALTGAGLLLVRRRYRSFLWVVAGLLVGLALQMSLNRWLAGEWVSVAAVIKAEGALRRLQSPFMGLTSSSYVGRRVLLASLLVAAGWTAWRQIAVRDLRPTFLWLGAAAFTVPHLLFSGIRSWYFVPAFLVLTVLAIRVREHGAEKSRRAAGATLLVAWIGAAGFAATELYSVWRNAVETDRVEVFVEEVRALVPPKERIFQVDGSGYMGFFSGRSVVNGDGLVNTHAYASRLRDRQLAGYLDEEDITYIITNRARDAGPVVDVGGLIVKRREVEELARRPGEASSPYTHFVLYRRRKVPDAETGSRAPHTLLGSEAN